MSSVVMTAISSVLFFLLLAVPLWSAPTQSTIAIDDLSIDPQGQTGMRFTSSVATALRKRLKELAARRMRFGYRRLTAMLLREGMPANHKRVYRRIGRKGWP